MLVRLGSGLSLVLGMGLFSGSPGVECMEFDLEFGIEDVLLVEAGDCLVEA